MSPGGQCLVLGEANVGEVNVSYSKVNYRGNLTMDPNILKAKKGDHNFIGDPKNEHLNKRHIWGEY